MTKDVKRATGQEIALPVTARHRDVPRLGGPVCRALLPGIAAVWLAAAPAPSVAQPRIELVSQTDRGFSAEGPSNTPALSANGRFVAFSSDAFNLIPPSQDRNERRDVFVRDRGAERTEKISRGVDGESDGASQRGGFKPAISGDGRFVAFASIATDLVEGDTNGHEDVFVYNRDLGVTKRVSLGIGEEANGPSSFPAISADGRYVAFQSQASNLVEDTNGVADIFLFDRDARTTRRVSVASDGTEADGFSITPAISGDGLVVAFTSAAGNLADGDTAGAHEIFVHEWETGVTERVSVSSSGMPANRISFLPALSFDGQVVAFKSEGSNLVPDDRNGVPDIFVHSRASGETERVSVDSFGNEADDLSSGPAISADGRYVVFTSAARIFDPDDGNGFSDVFVVDRESREIRRASVEVVPHPAPGGNVPDFPPSISADGRWIGFASGAANLAPDDINFELDAFIACNPFDPSGCQAAPPPTVTPEPPPCVGDCTGDGTVTIDELIRMVNLVLGTELCVDDPLPACGAADADCDCAVTVDEIVRAVNNNLGGCLDFGACPLSEHEAICCGP